MIPSLLILALVQTAPAPAMNEGDAKLALRSPQAPHAVSGPSPDTASAQALRAQYDWGYAGADGEGQGTLSVLLEPANGHLVLELHGLGERLVLVSGEKTTGYRIQIPRRGVDQTAPDLATLPLPFIPNLGGVEGLWRLLAQGEGPGVKVTKRDKVGPKKMNYTGKDEKGKEVLVWLNRQRWEVGP